MLLIQCWAWQKNQKNPQKTTQPNKNNPEETAPVCYGGRVWIQAAILTPCMEKLGVLFQSGLSAQSYIDLSILASVVT